ncbi:hypothetical protein E3N88_09607 [Mikania micrantha]|uniref:Uncharacterized protein n=1 Tax=Mikania micrantha TaxID=192012 RepID=A0A5N6PLH9_9ASTR|nr:hypothetical protein E3N88_09607 [Mikania micrantha]
MWAFACSDLASTLAMPKGQTNVLEELFLSVNYPEMQELGILGDKIRNPEEHADYLKLVKLTWGTLGITPKMHDILYGWVLFQRFIETEELQLLDQANLQVQKVLSDNYKEGTTEQCTDNLECIISDKETMFPIVKKKVLGGVLLDQEVDEKLQELTTVKLCVKLNALEYMQKQINILEDGIKKSWASIMVSGNSKNTKLSVETTNYLHSDSESVDELFVATLDIFRDSTADAIRKFCYLVGLPHSLVEMESKLAHQVLSLFSLDAELVIHMLMMASENLSTGLGSGTDGHRSLDDAKLLTPWYGFYAI